MEAIKYSFANKLHGNMLDFVKENSIVSVTDSRGRIEYANDKFCKILECDANKLIGETHELLKSHLHSDKVYKNLWRTIKMGNKWHGVLSDVSASGKRFWLDTTIIPINDDADNTKKFISLYTDVTKYHIQNIELLEISKTNGKYRSIFQSTNAGIIVITDHLGNVTEWNKGAELAFGYSKSEILGHPLKILFAKKFRKGNISALQATINKFKNDKELVELICMRKNGVEFPVEFGLSSLKLEQKGFYCAVMLDVSKRKMSATV